MQHNVRRIVTGHDAQGKAIFKDDTVHEMENINNGEAWFAKLWTTNVMPADDNNSAVDGATRLTGLTMSNGTVLRVVDMPPHGRSPMHRTSSVDYGIVLQGEVHLELDEGKSVKLLPGDVVVQRGTIHAWENKTDQFARMAFVLVDAKPAVVNGVELLPAHHD
ncbi:MAG: cupin domain-containing protein [Steroidobacteraceae bacterium]